MAKLKAKKSEEVVETVENSVEMTPEESEVLSADGEGYKDEQSEVSSQRMQSVLDLLQDEFDIRDKHFELTGYADKGNKIEATVNNPDFEIKFTLKSSTLMKLR